MIGLTIEELKKGEYETVEYKQDIPQDKDKYLKTAAAFANGAGGKLIFGVENNTWDVLGFSDDEVFQKYDAIANSIYDACMPAIVPVMGIEEIDSKKIIVANILPGMAKPYYLRSAGMMDGTYIRIAGMTRKAEPYMIKELQLEGTNTSFDAMQVVGDPIPEEEIDRLCEQMYQHALNLCRDDDQRQSQKRVTVSQLVSWKILVLFQSKYYPTNAWKLLTGDTEELIPDAFLQLASFKGNTRAVFLDRQEARGPIYQQIEDAMIFVKRHINLGSRIAGVYREDIYELPMDSVREMISNAVCHRSYLTPGSIQVAIYDDRLEVTSPGRISPDLTMEQMIAGNSRVRNVAIGAAFQYMHIIEKWGTGIPRIFQDAAKYGLERPELKDFGTSFRLVMFRRTFDVDPYGVVRPEEHKEGHQGSASYDAQSANLEKIGLQDATQSARKDANATQSADNITHGTQLTSQSANVGIQPADRIRELIRQNSRITRKQMAADLKSSERSIQRLLNTMSDVHFTGGGGKGHWIIDDK